MPYVSFPSFMRCTVNLLPWRITKRDIRENRDIIHWIMFGYKLFHILFSLKFTEYKRLLHFFLRIMVILVETLQRYLHKILVNWVTFASKVSECCFFARKICFSMDNCRIVRKYS